MSGRGRVRAKAPGNAMIFTLLYGIAGTFLIFVFVFLSKSLGDYAIYKSHSWIETEARFEYSEEYQQSVRRRKHTGVAKYRTVQVTRYRWQYSYEINGGQHYFTIDGKKESQPERQTRSIMVAADDPSIYLQYKNGGTLKAMLAFCVIIAVFGGLVIVGLIIILRKIQRKKTNDKTGIPPNSNLN